MKRKGLNFSMIFSWLYLSSWLIFPLIGAFQSYIRGLPLEGQQVGTSFIISFFVHILLILILAISIVYIFDRDS